MDKLLQFSGTKVTSDRVMDSNSLERERGITIAAKYTSINVDNITYNLVDTPGHADFGGELQRVINTVEGVLLLVDANEGPLAQTKYVLAKALERRLRPIVVLNKVDRPSATAQRCGEVESAVFDVFAALNATDEQLDFPILYASARDGWASTTLPDLDDPESLQSARQHGMAPLLNVIKNYVPPPSGHPDDDFSMLAVMTHKDPFLGRIVTGRIASGKVSIGDKIKIISHVDGNHCDGLKATKLFKKVGTSMIELQRASVGDIISLAGATSAIVADTVGSPELTQGIPPGVIDPPTLSMIISPNTSPFAGKEGTQLTGNIIGARLTAHAEIDVSTKVHPVDGSGGEAFEVQARGEMALGVLIENMRREGFELSISPPKVLMKCGDDGETLEPIEELVCEVDESHAGDVIEAATARRGELLEMGPAAGAEGRLRLVFEAPARTLVGFVSAFVAATRGSGILHRAFSKWDVYQGSTASLGGATKVRKGALVSTATGKATLHALGQLESRGVLFIEPGTDCYEGMVIGESARAGADLEVNPVKEKKLTNVRNTGSEEKVYLTPAKKMTLEEAIGYVGPDELIEVTPTVLRLRKKVLASGLRRAERRKSDS